MSDHSPLLLFVLLGGSAYVGKLWWEDLQAARAGRPAPRPLPGATLASRAAILLAAVGALVLLGIEVAGEYALGIVGQQREITVLFGIYTLAAAFVEELIFRGFIVVQHRGRAALIAGCIGASLVFAAIHPFLWEWKEGALTFQFTAKAWFSTAMIFAGSLWFHTVRFWSLNPTHSLLPCIAAHLAKNLGVFAIKAEQGFVVGWW
jgi:membrane protease YdiL (CAAX protease family)